MSVTSFVVQRRWTGVRQNATGRLRLGFAVLLAVLSLSLPSRGSVAGDGQPSLMVADFDFNDTSGEVVDQTAEHRDRVAAFAARLRENLAAEGYQVLRLDCPEPVCTATSMPPDDVIAAARRAGARLLIYGGIRKMSTLVQWGEVQLLDLDRNALLLRRIVTFRGDNDTAYRRAAEFVGETLKDAMPKP